MASRPVDPVPYAPVEPRPWRLTMGLRPLDVSRWLEVDGRRHDELEAKAAVLARDRASVVAALPGSEEAAGELLAAVVAHLGRHHPGLVTGGPGGSLIETTRGVRVDVAALHPVDAAARLVQEDLCLMTDDGGGWVLTAASVCFPSRWRLADKIGRDLSAIHGPVPGYATTLDRPTRAFFDRLRPERPVWRLNWTLLDDPALHQPDSAGRRPGHVPGDVGRGLWFRVERQTIRRLGARRAVTFTIRTYVCSLEELVGAHPEVTGALRTALPTVPEESLRYKGWTAVVEPVLRWLDDRGTS